MGIDTWLVETQDASIVRPLLILLDETGPPQSEIFEELVTRLLDHRTTQRVANDMITILGWEAARRRYIPQSLSVRRGDVGEMLATAVLEDIAELSVPVKKTRFQLHASSTQPSADVVALELDSASEVVGLHFCEAKLRTSHDASAAEEAHEQLRVWRDQHFADVLIFIAQRLEELNHQQYEAFIRFLADDALRADELHVILIWEASQWRDTVVTNLPQPPDLIEPLTVRALRISALADLTDDLYRVLEERYSDAPS